MGSMNMEKVVQVISELIIEGSEAVDLMARKRSSSSAGVGVQGGESQLVDVPDYLKIKSADIIEEYGPIGSGASAEAVH